MSKFFKKRKSEDLNSVADVAITAHVVQQERMRPLGVSHDTAIIPDNVKISMDQSAEEIPSNLFKNQQLSPDIYQKNAKNTESIYEKEVSDFMELFNENIARSSRLRIVEFLLFTHQPCFNELVECYGDILSPYAEYIDMHLLLSHANVVRSGGYTLNLNTLLFQLQLPKISSFESLSTRDFVPVDSPTMYVESDNELIKEKMKKLCPQHAYFVNLEQIESLTPI